MAWNRQTSTSWLHTTESSPGTRAESGGFSSAWFSVTSASPMLNYKLKRRRSSRTRSSALLSSASYSGRARLLPGCCDFKIEPLTANFIKNWNYKIIILGVKCLKIWTYTQSISVIIRQQIILWYLTLIFFQNKSLISEVMIRIQINNKTYHVESN